VIRGTENGHFRNFWRFGQNQTSKYSQFWRFGIIFSTVGPREKRLRFSSFSIVYPNISSKRVEIRKAREERPILKDSKENESGLVLNPSPLSRSKCTVQKSIRRKPWRRGRTAAEELK
jgi:hypothetical protein